MATSNELMRLARVCAERLDYPARPRSFPSFAEVEEQCGEEYEELLAVLHEDEVYASADLEEQERLVTRIRDALPEARRAMLEQLVDNQAAQVWLQQEGAFHLGMAVGLRLAQAGLRLPEEGDEDEDEEARREREDAVRFGRHHTDSRVAYDEDDDEEDEEGDDEDEDRRRH